MERYPTKEGIAVPIYDVYLPESEYSRDSYKYTNNHHGAWTARALGKSAVTIALRNLDRHQYVMPIDIHNWLHSHYEPPEMPTGEQAAREVVDAYDQGEQFKIKGKGGYRLQNIPLEMVDRFIEQYDLSKIYSIR